ncbi:MAG: hypothetical protein ACM3S0_05745 [Acidobacteriota bacterium]
MDKKLLGQYLVEDNKLSDAQIQKALEIQANSLNGSNTPLLGTLLVRMGLIKEQDVTQALERQTHDRNDIRWS